MAEKVTVVKTVVDKTSLSRVIDTTFRTFVTPTPPVDTDTVEELFRLYLKLYTRIPVFGTINSHEYLVKESSKLYTENISSVEIQPLLDEIASLRGQLLQANQQIAELTAQI